MTFSSRQILIVEDDAVQALDLERFLRKIGAEVLGPVHSIEAGMMYAREADAAILNLTLQGAEVFPLADTLQDLNIPFVFYTGNSHTRKVPARFRHIQLIRKPVQTLPDTAILALTAIPAAEDDDMLALLPKLRLAARLMYLDVAASDRLVERVLTDAIAHARSGGDLGTGPETAEWLMARMRQILDSNGTDLMN